MYLCSVIVYEEYSETMIPEGADADVFVDVELVVGPSVGGWLVHTSSQIPWAFCWP